MNLPIEPHGPIAAITPATLADHAAMCELAKVYAFGIDSRDEAMVRSVFAPDAPMRGALGEAPAHEYIPKLLAGVTAFDATMHNITNQYARVDGDAGVVWSYAVAVHLGDRSREQSDVTIGVQYRDECARTARGWWITARNTVALWSR